MSLAHTLSLCSAGFLLTNQVEKLPAGKIRANSAPGKQFSHHPAITAMATVLIYLPVCQLVFFLFFFLFLVLEANFQAERAAALNTLPCLAHNKQMRTANLRCQVDLLLSALSPRSPTTHKIRRSKLQYWICFVSSDDVVLLPFPHNKSGRFFFFFFFSLCTKL